MNNNKWKCEPKKKTTNQTNRNDLLSYSFFIHSVFFTYFFFFFYSGVCFASVYEYDDASLEIIIMKEYNTYGRIQKKENKHRMVKHENFFFSSTVIFEIKTKNWIYAIFLGAWSLSTEKKHNTIHTENILYLIYLMFDSFTRSFDYL